MDSLTSENSLQVSYNIGTRETIDYHFVPQRQAIGIESRTVRHLLAASVEQMGRFSSASKQQKNIVESKHEQI
jgi:hypothetical protein